MAFAPALETVRHARFRSNADVLVAGYLNHNACFLTGKGILTLTDCAYFNVRRLAAPRMYRELLEKRGTQEAPLSMCLNDDLHPGAPSDFAERLSAFLTGYLPEPSVFER